MATSLTTPLSTFVMSFRLVFYYHDFAETKMIEKNCSSRNEYKYQNSHGVQYCLPCSLCQPGSGMVAPCSKSADIVCSMCDNETFSHGGRKPCRPCRQCKGDSHVARECLPHKNTHCRTCKPGRYYSKEKQKCVKCTRCPPGSYVKRKCSPLHDTQCSPCPIGTYSDRYDTSPFCRRCNRCQTFEQILQVCNATQNNKCGSCKAGYFRLESTLDCVKCSYCYPESPGYTFQISDCTFTVNDTLYSCMPMLRPPPIQRNMVITTALLTDSTTDVKHDRLAKSTDAEGNGVIVLDIVALVVGILISSICICAFVVKYCSKNNQDFSSNVTMETYPDVTSQIIRNSASHSEPILPTDSTSFLDDCSNILLFKRETKSFPCRINDTGVEGIDNSINENKSITKRVDVPVSKSSNQNICSVSSMVDVLSEKNCHGGKYNPCFLSITCDKNISNTYPNINSCPMSDLKRQSC